MDTKFQKWLTSHKPDENMLWKDAFMFLLQTALSK